MAVAPVEPRGYRPALDGIRALAVLLVLADHIWHDPPLLLGAAGVTVFFALSGYLITGLLLDEVAGSGRVDFRRFYLRRTARLVPALVVVVVVCNTFFALVGDWRSVRDSVYALTYTANYVTAARDSYLSGYVQTWSLAVEEHFYLLWPLALLLMLRRRTLRGVLLWTLAACAASAAWRAGLLSTDTFDEGSRIVYHETLARADALLYGCAAAVAFRMGHRVPAWAAWPAAGVIGFVVVAGPGSPWYPVAGQAALAAAAALLVAAVDVDEGLVRRVLSVGPLVYVGAISYGLYLWHYPLIYVADGLGVGDSFLGRLVAGGLVALMASAVSFRFVEKPVRSWVRAHEPAILRRPDPQPRAAPPREAPPREAPPRDHARLHAPTRAAADPAQVGPRNRA